MLPPIDLLFAAALMSILSIATFFIAVRIGRRTSRRTSAIIAAAAAAVLLIYARWLYDSVLLTRVLPVADVLIWGNLQLPAAAVLAGIASSSLRSPLWQRALMAIALLSIGLYREFDPLIGSPPPLGPARWTHGICRQSTTSSCSAASAATLLESIGIYVTEADMASACLTHVTGTCDLGIYRGLRLRTAGTRWHVIAEHRSAVSIADWPLPALVNITLKGGGASWIGGGVRHSIVVLGLRPDGTLDIADPFAGRQTWTRSQFDDAFAGTAFSLVRNNHKTVDPQRTQREEQRAISSSLFQRPICSHTYH